MTEHAAFTAPALEEARLFDSPEIANVLEAGARLMGELVHEGLQCQMSAFGHGREGGWGVRINLSYEVVDAQRFNRLRDVAAAHGFDLIEITAKHGLTFRTSHTKGGDVAPVADGESFGEITCSVSVGNVMKSGPVITNALTIGGIESAVKAFLSQHPEVPTRSIELEVSRDLEPVAMAGGEFITSERMTTWRVNESLGDRSWRIVAH